MTSRDRMGEFMQRVTRNSHLYPQSFNFRKQRAREAAVALREATRVVDEQRAIPREQRVRSVESHLIDAERAARDGDEYIHVKVASEILRTRLARQVQTAHKRPQSTLPELRSIERRLLTIGESFTFISSLLSRQSNVIRRLEEGTLTNEEMLQRARDELIEARVAPSGVSLRVKLLFIAAACILVVLLF